VRFREVIDVDCPRAMAQLERMLKALDAYRQVTGPTDGSGTGDAGGSAGPSMTRQVEEAAAPAPPSPPPSPPPSGAGAAS
jgi:hypothetical protein